MIKKISHREQNVLIAGGTLIFLLLFCMYILQPKWEKIEDDQTTLLDLEQKIETLSVEREKKLKEKPETVENLKNQIRTLRSQLPVTRETAGFLNFIVKASETSGLNLLELSVDETEDSSKNTSEENTEQDSGDNAAKESSASEKKDDQENESVFVKGTKILPVTVRVLGSYKQLHDFTTSLEKLKRLNHIKSIIYARDRSGILMCEVSLDVYSWANGDEALNDPATIPKSLLPGKPDPYDSVGYAVYNDLGFNLRWDN